jgi:hypothetical protein
MHTSSHFASPTDRVDLGSSSDLPSLVYRLIPWAGAVLLALYLGATLLDAARRRRRLRAARRRFFEPAPDPLPAGLVTVAGTVATDALDGVAIRALAGGKGWSLFPDGSPRWHHGSDLPTFEVHPFALVLNGSGARVPVVFEPGSNLLGWPEMIPSPRTPAVERIRELSLRAGQRVVVDGLLAPGDPEMAVYREAEPALVLRGHGGGCLVIETEDFAGRLEREARLVRSVRSVIAGTGALFYLVPLAMYALDRLRVGLGSKPSLTEDESLAMFFGALLIVMSMAVWSRESVSNDVMT